MYFMVRRASWSGRCGVASVNGFGADADDGVDVGVDDDDNDDNAEDDNIDDAVDGDVKGK